MPAAGQLVDQPVDLGLGADVDAAGRLVQDQHARLARQPACRAPPSAGCRRRACAPAARSGAVMRDARADAARRRQPALGAAIERSRSARPARARTSVTLSSTLRSSSSASLLAVLGHQADAGQRSASAGVAQRQRPADDADLAAAAAGRSPKSAARQLGAAGAHQPGEADDLAGAHAKLTVVDRAGGRRRRPPAATSPRTPRARGRTARPGRGRPSAASMARPRRPRRRRDRRPARRRAAPRRGRPAR